MHFLYKDIRKYIEYGVSTDILSSLKITNTNYLAKMNSSLLIVTDINGYILNDFNFNDFKEYFKIIYIHNQNDKISKNHFSYKINKPESVVKDVTIKSIVFISFGSHLGGHDPRMYFKSVNNLESIMKILVNSNKNYLYHSSYLVPLIQ